MDKTRLEMTPFVTTKTQRDRPRWQEAPSYLRTKRRVVRARSMWAKIGICMALLAAVILFEVFIVTRDEPSVAVSAQESATGTDGEDTLGKLRFVEAGGVTSVFKVSQRWNVPVGAQAAELLDDDTLLKLAAEPGALVSAPAAGEVMAVSIDDEYGAYVRVNHGSDLESFYYNLT
ncbi:MAG: M23 family metallopeptidase, partial [Clostridia bacterium]|nr:M23 family metallopeptidase [Clostridia bacterium]